MQSLQTTELVELVTMGQSDAFDVLMGRFQRAVHAVAFAILSDREAALDVLQETFIAAFCRLHTLEDPEKFGQWICGIARNQARQHRRDYGRLGEVSLDGIDPFASQFRPNRRIDLVREALSELTEVQAEIVSLFYMEGYSVRECADLLKIPEGTVKRRLHDARQRLKKEMADMVETHLKEFALPEDYRVIIDKPSGIPSSHPSLTWFKNRWILIWQDGVSWGDLRWQCDRFEFWLSESPDAKTWSEPRRLDFGQLPQEDAFSFHLKQILVHNERLYIHAYQHGNGIDLYSSDDLINWTAHPRVRVNAGRAGVFSGDGGLFIACPAWVANDYRGDRVDLLKSTDDGGTWSWLSSPFLGPVG